MLAELDSQFDELEGGGAINPQYVIAINGGDATILSSYESAMLIELRHAVVNHAAIEGYPLSGEAVVSLVADPSIKRGTCRVTPVLAATPATPSPTTNSALASVVLADGQRVILDQDLIMVGRQSDCQVMIDDHNVSRHHAEIRRTTAGWSSPTATAQTAPKLTARKLLMVACW